MGGLIGGVTVSFNIRKPQCHLNTSELPYARTLSNQVQLKRHQGHRRRTGKAHGCQVHHRQMDAPCGGVVHLQDLYAEDRPLLAAAVE